MPLLTSSILQSYIMLLSCLCFLMLKVSGHAQSSCQEDYFQQRVDIAIDVKLNDETHYLTGTWRMKYVNQSRDTLTSIFMHLWPNAYRTKTTAFSEQLKNLGELDFFFSDLSQIGGIKDLKFTVGEDTLVWNYHEGMLDVALLALNEPLYSGDSIVMISPFTIKIPGAYSRLGHQEQSYQITQWYPKPAVYDRNGWHPMPYLHQGEFYSEFGDVEVNITLPENYYIAATGELKTEEEKARLNRRFEETKELRSSGEDLQLEVPTSSELFKTVRYVAKNVHDFAWFADKRFLVDLDTIELGEKSVTISAFYPVSHIKSWRDALTYAKQSLGFFSEKVGTYPYTHYTVTASRHKRGGGMEYPGLSVVHNVYPEQELEKVIAHEVGHNWFSGSLGFNERLSPWLDEGLTKFYEYRYLRGRGLSDTDELNRFLKSNPKMTFGEAQYLHYTSLGEEVVPCQHSPHVPQVEYWLNAYWKPAVSFNYLMQYLGEPQWDQCLQFFFQEWKFKHPDSIAFQNTLEECTGQNLDWFFDNFICSDLKIDFKLEQDIEAIEVKVGDGLRVPYPVYFYSEGQLVRIEWYKGEQAFTKRELKAQGIDQIAIDPERWLPDVNRMNNSIFLNEDTWSTKSPLYLRWISGLHDPDSRKIFLLPLLGGNAHNGFQAGLALHNIAWNLPRFEYYLAPMYAFGSNHLTGLADAGYYFASPRGKVKNLRLGLNFKSFHFRTSPAFELPLRMIRLQPSLEIDLKSDRWNQYSQRISLRSIHLWEEGLINFDLDQLTTGYGATWIKELMYTLERRSAVNPFSWRIAVEQQNYNTTQRPEHYLKIWTEWKANYTYAPKSNFNLRVFAGTFLMNSHRELGFINPGSGRGNFSLFGNGALDYKYDRLFVGRNTSQGLGANQISISDGGFKNAITREFDDGITNNYLLAVNLSMDLSQLPKWLPIRPYFDGGYTAGFERGAGSGPFDPNLFWSGGVELRFLGNMCAIYFPILNSENINRFYGERGNYWQRISFSWQFDLKRPSELIRKSEVPPLFQ